MLDLGSVLLRLGSRLHPGLGLGLQRLLGLRLSMRLGLDLRLGLGLSLRSGLDLSLRLDLRLRLAFCLRLGHGTCIRLTLLSRGRSTRLACLGASGIVEQIALDWGLPLLSYRLGQDRQTIHLLIALRGLGGHLLLLRRFWQVLGRGLLPSLGLGFNIGPWL